MKPALFSVLCEIKEKTGRPLRRHFWWVQDHDKHAPLVLAQPDHGSVSRAVLPVTSLSGRRGSHAAFLPGQYPVLWCITSLYFAVWNWRNTVASE